MITEKELERALELQKLIKELRVKIAKIQDVKISTTEIGSPFSIDNNRIDVDKYTIGVLRKFKSDILKVYETTLEELEKEYKGIIISEADVIERAIFGDDEEEDE